MTLFRRVGANDGIMHSAELRFTNFPQMGLLGKDVISVSPGNCKYRTYEERLTVEDFKRKYEVVVII